MEAKLAFWDNMAKRYPRFNDASMSKDVNHILNWCHENDVLFENMSVLDIGAGKGSISIPLAQKGARVTAIDVSAAMLEALNEDAAQTGVSHHVQTHQSDWDAFALAAPYDIVIASMTPAINDVQKIEKMLGASKQLGIYVGWGKYRTNKLVEALVQAHTRKEEDDCSSAGCFRVAQFMEILDKKKIAYKSTFFDTGWEETYSFEEAKEYAYEQLGRKELTPDDAIIESILINHMQNDQVIVQTQAEKGVVLWSVA